MVVRRTLRRVRTSGQFPQHKKPKALLPVQASLAHVQRAERARGRRLSGHHVCWSPPVRCQRRIAILIIRERIRPAESAAIWPLSNRKALPIMRRGAPCARAISRASRQFVSCGAKCRRQRVRATRTKSRRSKMGHLRSVHSDARSTTGMLEPRTGRD